MLDYNKSPSTYKGIPIYVRLAGFCGDLPEFFSISSISWGQVCNECYIEKDQVFNYDGGLCNHMRNEKERNALIQGIKTGSNVKSNFGYMAPVTNV